MKYGVIVVTLAFLTEISAIKNGKNEPSREKVIFGDKRREREDDVDILRGADTGASGEIKDKGGGEEDEKTLSQQVADGKYGLIHDELFAKPPKRPGILSYKVNPEVPKDNVNNLGGLDAEDIWLAENHLLVLAGKFDGGKWTPIDNYQAPRRQVKIPSNPRVPPPFPVQLTDGGPVQFIGGPPNGGPPFGPPFNAPSYLPPIGLPPLPIQTLRPFPPGSGFLPSRGNSTEIDEDDPRQFYPPPYDFVYPKDNVSRVPAGPLVPGIVLPPPPDFFAPLENGTDVKSRTKAPLKIVDGENYNRRPTYEATTTTAATPTTPLANYAASPFPAFVNYNEIPNEVTPHDLEDRKTDEWIPIPGPKPYHITGPVKPVQKSLSFKNTPELPQKEVVRYSTTTPSPTKYNDDYNSNYLKQNSFSYSNPQKYLLDTASYFSTSTTPTPYEDNNIHTDSSKSRTSYVYHAVPSSTQRPYEDVTRQTASTIPANMYNPPIHVNGGGNSVQATYYFYEEPKDVSQSPLYPKPHPTEETYRHPNPVYSSSSFNFNAGPDTSTIKPFVRKNPAAPTIPIHYLGDLDNAPVVSPQSEIGHRPVPANSHNEHEFTTHNPTAFAQQPEFKRPTSKPIFEYSFGYSTTTGHPKLNHERFPNHKAPSSFNFFENSHGGHINQAVPTPNPPYRFHVPGYYDYRPLPSSTPKPYYPSREKPAIDSSWVPNDPYRQDVFHTDNPFYAFFTKEDEDLIDDNTKEYFTIFGKKIKPQFSATSPVPSYTTTRSIVSESRQRPNTRHVAKYDKNARGNSGAYGTKHAPVSLAGDTRVNYINPPPPDPDAEFIDTRLAKEFASPYEKYVSRVRDHENDAHSDYQQRPVSLAGDTRVNYVSSVSENPHSESLPHQKGSVSLEGDTRVNYVTNIQRDPDAELVDQKSPSLEGDVRVNYLGGGGDVDPDSQILDAPRAGPLRWNTDTNYATPKRPKLKPIVVSEEYPRQRDKPGRITPDKKRIPFVSYPNRYAMDQTEGGSAPQQESASSSEQEEDTHPYHHPRYPAASLHRNTLVNKPAFGERSQRPSNDFVLPYAYPETSHFLPPYHQQAFGERYRYDDAQSPSRYEKRQSKHS